MPKTLPAQLVANLTARKTVYLLITFGLVLEVGLLVIIGLGDLTRQVGWYIGVILTLFVIFGLTVWLITAKTESQSQKGELLVIVFFTILLRLTALFAAPTLSTDQFRYTWEGRLVNLGISPYQYSPADPALLKYRSGIWQLVQQKETTSPYPPISQIIGAVEYRLFGESLLGPKITAVFFDLLSCAAIFWLLAIYKLDRRRLILYAWCPLPIIEFGQSGHNDGPMLFLLLLAIGLATQSRPRLSALTVGLASLAKFTPLFGLPLFLVNWQALRTRSWGYVGLVGLVMAVGYAPFVLLGNGALGSIFEYSGTWHDNDSLIVQLIADWVSPIVAKALSLIVLGGVVLLLSFHPRLTTELSLPRRLSLVFGTVLLVASTVHAWYLTWLLVLLPLVYWQEARFKAWDWGWLLFAALVQLPYLSYGGNLAVYNWIKPLEYWPLYGLVGWSLFYSRRLSWPSLLTNKLNKKETRLK